MVYWCSNTLQNYDKFFNPPNNKTKIFEKSDKSDVFINKISVPLSSEALLMAGNDVWLVRSQASL